MEPEQIGKIITSQFPKRSATEALESYKHIELTEEETAEAILWRKQQKEKQLREKALHERAAENRRALTATRWSYEQTRGFMIYRAENILRGFALDQNNQAVFDLLCYYFSEDPQFTTIAHDMGISMPSLSKGICLAGMYGVGKTWLMRLFAKNQRQCYSVKSAKQIADTYEADGEGDNGLSEFIQKPKNAVNDMQVFYQPHMGLCVDDIGTEDIKNHFGNKKNVIGDLIEKRYSLGNTGTFLHATTNFNAEQIESFYGGRVRSRMREIFNFIELKGADRRK